MNKWDKVFQGTPYRVVRVTYNGVEVYVVKPEQQLENDLELSVELSGYKDAKEYLECLMKKS